MLERMFESERQQPEVVRPRYSRVMTGVSTHDVAADLCRRLPGPGVKKLHKLLYYCQGHHLAAFGEQLFKETVSAWDMGPVVGTLWYAERNGESPDAEADLTEGQLNTNGYVVSRYGALAGGDLELLTHSEPPWQEANMGRRPSTPAKIPAESLRAYFRVAQDTEEDRSVPVPDTATVTEWLRAIKGAPTDSPAVDSIDELRARLARGDRLGLVQSRVSLSGRSPRGRVRQSLVRHSPSVTPRG